MKMLAVDAIASQGTIHLISRIVEGAVEVEIRDTGRGIPSDQLPHIFDPFYATKDVGQGVGLGLTTALNIVKMHNGAIHCQSEPGNQTVFTVVLPTSAEIASPL